MEPKIWIWILCSVLLLVTACSCASRKKFEETKCYYYNETICNNSKDEEGCTSIQNCKAGDNDKPSYCYAVWTNNTKTNKLEIKLKVIQPNFYKIIIVFNFIMFLF